MSISATDSSPSAASPIPDGAERCTVAAGCFWGTEHLYRKYFADKGLLDAKVGYIGGDLENPSYRAVCGGRTGREFGSLSFPLVVSTIFLLICRLRNELAIAS